MVVVADQAVRSTSRNRAATEVRLHFGAGCLRELGPVCDRLGAGRVLVVSDPGIVAAGHVDVALASLRDRGLTAAVFDGVAENPTSDHVADGARLARELAPDVIVGLGGGSSMDCAKGVNFVLAGGGSMEDYRGFGRGKPGMLPSVGVPCTAGTGSEAQSFALITHPRTHHKMACGDPVARFGTVLLDPLLLRTVPRAVAAVAGFRLGGRDG